MSIKTFTAEKMPVALALVKRDLGPRAVILHTRTYKRGGVLGLGGRTVVEITAADAETVGRRTTRTPARIRPPGAPGADLIRRTYAPSGFDRQNRVSPEPVPPRSAAPDTADRGAVAATRASEPPIASHTEQLAAEMSAVKQMVGRMFQDQRQRSRTDGKTTPMPQHLLHHYLRLLEQEVAEELADEVVEQLRSSLDDDQMQQEGAVKQAVLDRLSKLIPTDDAADRLKPTADGRPRTIALIGPTGVGKTTTIAKLAAIFKLRQKKNVALITIDTYRIAAVDQLQTYANIIGVPLHVVLDPEQLESALNKCAGCDVVLIDTAGRSQRDDAKLEHLDRFVRAADPHEVHLVLSSTCTEAAMFDTVDRFSMIRFDRIIFTKLDEAVTFGVLLNVTRRVNKQLSFVTTGQDVPHDIEPGRPSRIAGLVLGEGV